MYDHTHSLPVFLGLKSKGLARCVDQEIALSPWGLFPQLGLPQSQRGGQAAIVPLAACSPLCLPPLFSTVFSLARIHAALSPIWVLGPRERRGYEERAEDVGISCLLSLSAKVWL